ncbi:MAG: Polysialic acid transport protein KpsD precursor [Bacteroidetes bacterium ADurb.Bin174]|nr:MAG: Polysialic acid transport protein KpsD precursor [Bacteroidetes bacterium ADurb.Bin174]
MKKSLLILLLITPFVLQLHAQDLNSMTPQQRMLLLQQLNPNQKQFGMPSNIQQYNPGSYLPQSQGGNLPVNVRQMSDFRKYIQALNANLDEGETPYYVDERTFVEDSLYREFMIQGDEKKMKVFGSNIFNKGVVIFEPNLNLPTPANYIIGTNDELLIDISGLYDVSYKLKVTPDGNVRIPNVGLIKVGGMTFESANTTLKRQLSKYYTGIDSGETKVDINLGKIRSIKVTAAGEVSFPGTYTLPSLATVINALYSCGGPNKIGSMRSIKIIRNAETVAEIDFYQFLMTGALESNIVLQDNDILIVEPNRNEVVVDGAIKRRGYYEFVQGEALSDLLYYAGGLSGDANRNKITIYRYADAQKTIIDVSESSAASTTLAAGDSIFVSKIEDIYDNRVELSGAVKAPGTYALTPDLTIKSLINKAGGVQDEAFLNVATIQRQKKNENPEMISFNLGKILAGEDSDIALINGDFIVIDSLQNFMDEQFVTIQGKVKKPGRYPLNMKMNVRDLVFLAKGFTDGAETDNIQIVRIIKDPTKMEEGSKKSFTFTISLDKDLNFGGDDGTMYLENGDLVIVRSIEGIEPIRMASVEGEVKNPGFYTVEHKNIRVSDLLERTGGFTPYASISSAYLIRNEENWASDNPMAKIFTRNLRRILQSSKESSLDMALSKMQISSITELNALDTITNYASIKDIQELLYAAGVVSLDLEEIVKSPGSLKDLFVENGDVLVIPKKSQTVKVIGEVMYPSFVVYSNTNNFKDYIISSGGFSNKALKKNSFVLYPNGKVIGTRSFLGIKFYPRVVAGSMIIVPQKPISLTNKMTPAEVITITSSVTSTMVLLYSIISNQIKK